MKVVTLRQIEFAALGSLFLAIHAGAESGLSHLNSETFETKRLILG